MGSREDPQGVGGASMTAIDYLIGRLVLADLGSYQISGRLLSCRQDEMTLQTRAGTRILINRQETKSIRELAGKKRRKA